MSTPKSSLDRIVDALGQAGLRYRRSGSTHVQAQCPSHGADSHASLSIDYDAGNERVLLHCHASCADEEVLEALGLTVPMLYDDFEPLEEFKARRAQERELARRTGAPAPTRKPKATKKPVRVKRARLPRRVVESQVEVLSSWQEVETYDYTDAEGTTVHQVVRKQRQAEVLSDPAGGVTGERTEKLFSQRWPDGRGDWVTKAPSGFEPVLYRLPDVLAAIENGTTVWVCEGEKDADRLCELGLTATTNPSGASNVTGEQAQTLAGGVVRVVVDHDLAGYRRGLRLLELLEDRADEVEVVLPKTAAAHQDISDHLDAGYDLDEVEQVTRDQLEQLAAVAEVEKDAAVVRDAQLEAHARQERAAADATKAPKRAGEEQKAAHRWAEEAGHRLTRVIAAADEIVAEPLGEVLEERLKSCVAGAQQQTQLAYEAAQSEPAGEVAAALAITWRAVGAKAQVEDDRAAGSVVVDRAGEVHVEEHLPLAAGGGGGRGARGGPATGRGDDEEPEEPSNVYAHPTAGLLSPPSERIAFSRKGVTFAFEVKGGPGRVARGVYMNLGDQWEFISPLPYVSARVVLRDGRGRTTGTSMMISLTDNDPNPLLVGPRDLSDFTWINTLDIPVSRDETIRKAVQSALDAHAATAPLVEATPRMGGDGQVLQTHPGVLPSGYAVHSDLGHDEAMRTWTALVRNIAESPRMALMLGASAIAPFLAGLAQQSHVMCVVGDPMQGKSTTLGACAALWGFPGERQNEKGVVADWNATTLSITEYLGMLGILPAFFDEIGQKGKTDDAEWHALISNITQGASRMRMDRMKGGTQDSLTWGGIFFTSGNGPMGGQISDRNAGVGRRYMELQAPLTLGEEHAELVEEQYRAAYGHLGQEILDRHTVSTLQPLIEQAEEALGGGFETNHERAMMKHLRAHLAGALVIDDICNTDGALFASACMAAAEYLEECSPPAPVHERFLDEIRDWIAREPGAWPTREELRLLTQPRGMESDSLLPAHGTRPVLAGFIDEVDNTVRIGKDAMKQIVTELESRPGDVCRPLYELGLLKTMKSRRAKGEWKIPGNAIGWKADVYAVMVPPKDSDDLDDEPAFKAPPPAADGPNARSTGRLWHPRPLADVDEPAAADPAPSNQAQSGGSNGGTNGGWNGGSNGGAAPSLTCDNGGNGGAHAHASHVYVGPRGKTADSADERSGGSAVVEQQDPAAEGVTSTAAAPVEAAAATRTGERRPTGRTRGGGGYRNGSAPGRFTAPAAVLTAETIHLPGGLTQPWPEHVQHLGDLAQLAAELRLGWGGGEDRLPDIGQVWLYPDALERLGLPVELEDYPDQALTRAERAEISTRIFSAFNDLPVVAGAVADGWEIGSSGHMNTWTRVYHPERLRQGAFIVAVPWQRITGVDLVETPGVEETDAADDTETGLDGELPPSTLAERLQLFAQQMEISYRVSPTATGVDLIDHFRPPRRHHDDQAGDRRRRVALVRGEAGELPPWMGTSDSRYRNSEKDFAYHRPWDSLSTWEQQADWVHAYDRNASYLTPWRSAYLGVEGLQHRVGEDAGYDGRERPGYFLIDAVEWEFWGLPDPLEASGAVVEGGRRWVPVTTLEQMKLAGVTPVVHEAFTWDVSAKYLETPGQVMSDARKALLAGGTDEAAVRDTIKQIYAKTVGKLAARERPADYHLWRPDWREHIMGWSKVEIMRTLIACQNAGQVPLAVNRDAIFFASNESDPAKAWPGPEHKLSSQIGSWKPIGTAAMEQWGPAMLVSGGRKFRYADATDALSVASDEGGEQ